ncbi:uncharacterized protein METZ01_LOCUS88576, partial [marine metagenome]
MVPYLVAGLRLQVDTGNASIGEVFRDPPRLGDTRSEQD